MNNLYENTTGPQFIKYMSPTIAAIKAMGGSGTVQEINAWIIQEENISEQELAEKLKSGASKILNLFAWARVYLGKFLIVSTDGKGIWSLTENGINEVYSRPDFLEMFKAVQLKMREDRKIKEIGPIIEPSEDVLMTLADEILGEIKKLPPSGFENLCQRILRDCGFTEVHVTGKSGDRGIDGIGILKLNSLIGTKVIFQCKRYTDGNTVGPSEIRDFRGTMAGRTDKGLFITTSRFTLEAQREAIRDGVPTIELIDGERLSQLMIDQKIGVTEKTVLEMDKSFFRLFQSSQGSNLSTTKQVSIKPHKKVVRKKKK